MTPELQRHLDDLDALREDARSLAGPLARAQFNWQPSPDEWSVGQCLAHLNVAGFLLLPRLERAVERGRAEGLTGSPPFRYGPIGRLFAYMMQPDPRFRLRSPPAFQPALSLEPDVVVPRFVDLQRRLAAVVRRADGLDLRRIRLSSPAARLAHFNLGIWFRATVAHEQRHLLQARQVRAHDAFPAMEA